VAFEGYVEAVEGEDEGEEMNFGVEKFQAEFAVVAEGSIDEDRCGRDASY
jgi:hypothetical protein